MALIISFQNSNVVFKKASDWLIEGIYCICYDFQAAKLHTSGLSLPALEMIQYYLLNRKQKKKWILIYYMGKFYIWCFARLYLKIHIVYHNCMWLVFGTWRLLQECSRCNRYSSYQYYSEALYLISQQSNKSKS